MNKVWNFIQRIKGKHGKGNVHHLKDGQNLLTSENDISRKLAETFSKHSSSQNYSSEFQRIQKTKEKNKINFKSKN